MPDLPVWAVFVLIAAAALLLMALVLWLLVDRPRRQRGDLGAYGKPPVPST